MVLLRQAINWRKLYGRNRKLTRGHRYLCASVLQSKSRSHGVDNKHNGSGLMHVDSEPLHRPVACKSDPMHHPPKAMIVIDWVVLRYPVVPEGDGVWLPPKAAGEVGFNLMRKQIC